MSWNLGNYLQTSRMTVDGFREDYPKPEDEKAGLRATLLSLQPDILVVQEIGAEPYLRELQRDLKLIGMNLPHLAHGGGSDAERHLGLLSRWPLEESEALSPDLLARDTARLGQTAPSDRMRRGVLACVVRTPPGPIAVFCVHLKSRRTDDPDDPGGRLQRSAEARAVREALSSWLHRRPPLPALLLGDFNSSIDSPELLSVSRRGETKLWRRLDATDAHGETWTYHHARSGDYATIDHALLGTGASGLAAHAQISDRLRGPEGAQPSDHRPLLIRLTHGSPEP